MIRKPLTVVAGVPLVIRAVQSLETAGCCEIVVVLGHEPDPIRQTVESGYGGNARVKFVTNDRYDLQNGVSLLAARPHLNGEFILMMADHIVDDETMERARLHTPRADTATLLVDYKLKSVFDMDDATKVLEIDNRVDEIGKKPPKLQLCRHGGLRVYLETSRLPRWHLSERRGRGPHRRCPLPGREKRHAHARYRYRFLAGHRHTGDAPSRRIAVVPE